MYMKYNTATRDDFRNFADLRLLALLYAWTTGRSMAIRVQPWRMYVEPRVCVVFFVQHVTGSSCILGAAGDV